MNTAQTDAAEIGRRSEHHMTLAKNTFAFEAKRPAPKRTGKGPQSKTHALAVAQGGDSLPEFVAAVTAFIDAGTSGSVTALAPKQATAQAPAPSKTVDMTDVVDAAIAVHVSQGDGRHNAAFYRPVRKAALAGPSALRTYISTLAAPKGPYKATCAKFVQAAVKTVTV